MTVIGTENGKWAVVSSGNTLAGPFETMAEAWRWIDRHQGDAINPAEKKSEWISGKILGGAA